MYKVFGYDDLCTDFSYAYDSFVQAVKAYLSLDREGMNVVFITGVSTAVGQRLRTMF